MANIAKIVLLKLQIEKAQACRGMAIGIKDAQVALDNGLEDLKAAIDDTSKRWQQYWNDKYEREVTKTAILVAELMMEEVVASTTQSTS